MSLSDEDSNGRYYSDRELDAILAQRRQDVRGGGRMARRAADRFGPPPAPPSGPFYNQADDEPAGAPQFSLPLLAGVVALLLVVVGGALQFSSVSVLTGAGILWVGTALAVGGAVIAITLKARTWIAIVAIVVSAVCVLNVVVAEHSLSEKRQEISNLLSN